MKSKVLFEWETPQKVKAYDAKLLRSQAKTAIPRILLITTIALVIVYFLLKDFMPLLLENGKGSFKGIPIAVFIFAFIMIAYVYLIGPLLLRYSKDTFKICEDGIRSSITGHHHFFSWKHIQSYSLSTHPQFPDIRTMIFDLKNRTLSLYLPQDAVAEQIIGTVGRRILYIENFQKDDKEPKFTLTQWVYILLVMIVYSVSLAYLYILLLPFNPHLISFLPLISLAVGPATLCFLNMFGLDFYKKINSSCRMP